MAPSHGNGNSSTRYSYLGPDIVPAWSDLSNIGRLCSRCKNLNIDGLLWVQHAQLHPSSTVVTDGYDNHSVGHREHSPFSTAHSDGVLYHRPRSRPISPTASDKGNSSKELVYEPKGPISLQRESDDDAESEIEIRRSDYGDEDDRREVYRKIERDSREYEYNPKRLDTYIIKDTSMERPRRRDRFESSVSGERVIYDENDTRVIIRRRDRSLSAGSARVTHVQRYIVYERPSRRGRSLSAGSATGVTYNERNLAYEVPSRRDRSLSFTSAARAPYVERETLYERPRRRYRSASAGSATGVNYIERDTVYERPRHRDRILAPLWPNKHS